MTEHEVADFVTRFAAAWAARDGQRFLDLWHADGTLHSPLYDRAVKGSEFAQLTALIVKAAPDQVWQLLDWTWRPKGEGAIVIVEWQSTRVVEGKRFDWRGVDKITLQNGKIVEEIVYFDTAPLRARRSGVTPEALVPLGA
jgi:ketosteroid isomerase-like protein